MIETSNVTISIQTNVKQAEGLIASNMDGEKVVLSISNGKYYNLEVIGGRIWDLLSESMRTSEIVDVLLQEYQIDQKSCETEVLTFLHQLYDEGLIETC